MANEDVKEILTDTENLLRKISHKICDILIGSSRKKMEKVLSDQDVIIHLKRRKNDPTYEGEK